MKMAWLTALCLLTRVLVLPASSHQPSWPDRVYLTDHALAWQVDPLVTLAIAWQESAADTNPHLRGHRCWYTIRAHWNTWVDEIPGHGIFYDSTWVPRVVHHEPDCEVGRFQIKPSTAHFRCPDMNIFTYNGNVACFLHMFHDDVITHDVLWAIRKHNNGSGRPNDVYQKDVLATVGWLVTDSVTSSGVDVK